MDKIIFVLFFGFLISSCGVTKEWVGNSMPRNNQATFGQFSGKQEFKMTLFGADTLSRFHYRFRIEKGAVQLLVKQGKETLLDLKDIADAENELMLENKGTSTIAVILQGKEAKGSFNMAITPATSK